MTRLRELEGAPERFRRLREPHPVDTSEKFPSLLIKNFKVSKVSEGFNKFYQDECMMGSGLKGRNKNLINDYNSIIW